MQPLLVILRYIANCSLCNIAMDFSFCGQHELCGGHNFNGENGEKDFDESKGRTLETKNFLW